MSLPPWKVEIDADPDVTGLFVLDVSTLDGTDVLATDTRFVAIPADDVRAVNVKRGRARDDQANDVGTATIELDAWSGNYDPDNPAGPYQYNGERLLRQGMQVRVSVTIDSTDHAVFTGALETTAGGYGRAPSMTWTCVDMLSRLGHASFPPSATVERAGDTSSERVAWLLAYDAAYADRQVTAGGRTLIGTQGGGTVLSNLEDVARSEWGRVYADRNNVLTVTHHADEYIRQTTLTISDSGTDGGDPVYPPTYPEVYPGLSVLEPDDLSVEPGLNLVVNRAVLTRHDAVNVVDGDGVTTVTTTDVTIVGEDGPSVDRFGNRSQTADILLASDSEAQQLADYLAHRRSGPSPLLTTVTTSLAGHVDAAMASAADLELGDWVRVERQTADGRPLVWRVSAEGIEHTSAPDGWRLTVNTAPLDVASLFGSAGWFTLDVSALNGPDVLAAF